MLDGSLEESEECNQPKNDIEIQSKNSSEENLAHAVSSTNTALTLNGILTSEDDSLFPARTNHPTRLVILKCSKVLIFSSSLLSWVNILIFRVAENQYINPGK